LPRSHERSYGNTKGERETIRLLVCEIGATRHCRHDGAVEFVPLMQSKTISPNAAASANVPCRQRNEAFLSGIAVGGA
jgi:hypothetical protein